MTGVQTCALPISQTANTTRQNRLNPFIAPSSTGAGRPRRPRAAGAGAGPAALLLVEGGDDLVGHLHGVVDVLHVLQLVEAVDEALDLLGVLILLPKGKCCFCCPLYMFIS